MSALRAFPHTVPSTWNITSPLPHILTGSSLLGFSSLLEHLLFGKTALPLRSHCHPSPFLGVSPWHSGLPRLALLSVSPPRVSAVPGTQWVLSILRVFLLLTGTTPGRLALESAARWMRAHHGPSRGPLPPRALLRLLSSGSDYAQPSVGPYPELKRLLCSLLCLHPKGYG